MKYRPRILRQSEALRQMVSETDLKPSDLIAPLFIVEGSEKEDPISALPGYYRRSLDCTLKEVQELYAMGIRSVLLFAQCAEELKDNKGTEALNPDGLMQRSIRAIKEKIPEICVMTDVALDPYSSYGHDGIVLDSKVLNDVTVEVLGEMALSHVQAGCDVLAPSDMMDGRVGRIREILEKNGHHDTGIMSYTAKYASCFYGPFRSALDSAPGFGDKKSYQMNPANRREAIREADLDEKEGADILMVKPALSYLDIIREIRNRTSLPVSAYHVSGEYAMIKAAADKGWVNEDHAIMESTLSIKRAGADLIATYFARDIVRLLEK